MKIWIITAIYFDETDCEAKIIEQHIRTTEHEAYLVEARMQEQHKILTDVVVTEGYVDLN